MSRLQKKQKQTKLIPRTKILRKKRCQTLRWEMLELSDKDLKIAIIKNASMNN